MKEHHKGGRAAGNEEPEAPHVKMAPNTSRTWKRTVFTFASTAPAPKSIGELGAPFTFAHTVGNWAGGASNSSPGEK